MNIHVPWTQTPAQIIWSACLYGFLPSSRWFYSLYSSSNFINILVTYDWPRLVIGFPWLRGNTTTKTTWEGNDLSSLLFIPQSLIKRTSSLQRPWRSDGYWFISYGSHSLLMTPRITTQRWVPPTVSWALSCQSWNGPQARPQANLIEAFSQLNFPLTK